MGRFFTYGSLPSLEFGTTPDISSKALIELLDLNLAGSSLKKVYRLRLWIDLSNIYFFVLNDAKFDSRGNYSRSALKSLITSEEELPLYVIEFFARFETDEERKENFPYLLTQYFQEGIKEESGFMVDFLRFERDLRNLMVGLRGKKLGRDVAHELQFEEDSDPIVSMVLMQKDREGKFQFPYEYRDLETLLDAAEGNPLQQFEEIARYRFTFYYRFFTDYPFTLKAILAYMMALWILEDVISLKEEEGRQLMDNLVEREHGA